MATYFIGDTHFGHDNIIKFCRPQFSGVAEMDEVMIENWNKVVRRGLDTVYHVGDFAWSVSHARNVVQKLNGSKRLIPGNHDNPLQLARAGGWTRIYGAWREFREYGFIATHVPIRLDQIRHGHFNVHGHIHDTFVGDPHYINVCVEKRNFTPVHIDEIIAEMERT